MNYQAPFKSLPIALAFIISTTFVGMTFTTACNQGNHGNLNSKVRLGSPKTGAIINRVTLSGIVVPARKTIITAPYSGYVRKLFVKVGDKVKQGDPIVSIAQSIAVSDDVYPVRSPFSGTIVQVKAKQNEYVKAENSAEFIARLDDVSRLYIEASAPEITWPKLKIGQEAVITATALSHRTYQGILKTLSLSATDKDNWRGSLVEFPIRIEVIDPDEQLRPGMSANLEIIASKKEQVLTLGHEFIHQESGGKGYYVLLASGEKRPIKVGMQNEEAFEILEGLNEGENVRQVDFSALNSDSKTE